MEQTKKNAITIQTACKLIGCKSSAFYSNHKKNLTPIGKIGRVVIYHLADVQRYCEEVKKISDEYQIVET